MFLKIFLVKSFFVKTLTVSLFLFFGLSSLPSMAQDLMVEKVVESSTKETNSFSAKKELMDLATLKAAEEIITEVIGEAKFNRNRSVIQNKILKNNARFIPFAKPGELISLPEGGFKMAATFKINQEELKNLLLENGLFYETDSTPMILPSVKWKDRVNDQQFGWWYSKATKENQALSKESELFEDILKGVFQKSNFYLVRSQNFNYVQMLAYNMRTENTSVEDLLTQAGSWGAQLVLSGDIQVEKNQQRPGSFQIELKLTAIQAVNSRVVAEVSRKFETDVGAFELVVSKKLKEITESTAQDLANQVFEAWQRGSIGSALYKLTIKGKLSLPLQESVKDLLKIKVKEIKDVTERVVAGDRLGFEIDSSISPKDILAKLPQFELQGFVIKGESASEKEVIYVIQK